MCQLPSSTEEHKIKRLPVLIFLAGSTSGVHVGWGEVKVPIDHHRVSCGSDILLRAAKDGYFGVGIEQAGLEKGKKNITQRLEPNCRCFLPPCFARAKFTRSWSY